MTLASELRSHGVTIPVVAEALRVRVECPACEMSILLTDQGHRWTCRGCDELGGAPQVLAWRLLRARHVDGPALRSLRTWCAARGWAEAPPPRPRQRIHLADPSAIRLAIASLADETDVYVRGDHLVCVPPGRAIASLSPAALTRILAARADYATCNSSGFEVDATPSRALVAAVAKDAASPVHRLRRWEGT